MIWYLARYPQIPSIFYCIVLWQENLYYGEAEIYHRVDAEGDGGCYWIEKEGLSEFLDSHELKRVEMMDVQ